MRNKILKIIYEYLLIGTKILLAFITVLFNTIILSYIYFIIDIIASFYQKYQDDKNRDLSIESFDSLKNSSKKLQINFDRMAKSQQKYEQDRVKKEDSLRLLNRLIAEGLIRGKDLLSLAGTSGFFQLFIYSSPLNKLATSLGMERPQRQYPIFLEELGFVRLGKNSSFFLINKNRLVNENLKNIRVLKKFLTYHFSKIRTKEWNDFLGKIKEINKKEYLRLKIKSCREWGYLKYNYLLTETNMNPTNIGFVDSEYLGLGSVYNDETINSQILEKSNSGNIEVSKQLKVKIRKIIEKLDISLLLDGILNVDKNIIDLKQDIIKKNLNVKNIIDFSKISIIDLDKELKIIGLNKKRSQKTAIQIIETTKVYKNALTELNISIN